MHGHAGEQRLLEVYATEFLCPLPPRRNQTNMQTSCHVSPLASFPPYLCRLFIFISFRKAPDAFPPGRSELSIDPSSQRGRIARRTSRSSVSGSSVRRAASPRRQSHPRLRADPPTENTPPSTQSRPVCGVRQRRSFGIFCTGKKSVVGRPVERRGRDVGR